MGYSLALRQRIYGSIWYASQSGSAGNFTFLLIRVEILRWKQKAIIFALMVSLLIIVDQVFQQSFL